MRGLAFPKDMLVTNEDMDVKKSQDETSNDADFHRFDEQVRSMIATEPNWNQIF